MSTVELKINDMELVRTRAVICGTCRHAVGGVCEKDQKTIASHLGAAGDLVPCPISRQADENGHVHRLGVKHVGMPWLWRVWRWSEARDERWLQLPGCGCVVALKAAWLNLKARAGARR